MRPTTIAACLALALPLAAHAQHHAGYPGLDLAAVEVEEAQGQARWVASRDSDAQAAAR